MGLLTAVCSAAGAYAAVRVEIKYLRRDVDAALARITSLEKAKGWS